MIISGQDFPTGCLRSHTPINFFRCDINCQYIFIGFLRNMKIFCPTFQESSKSSFQAPSLLRQMSSSTDPQSGCLVSTIQSPRTRSSAFRLLLSFPRDGGQVPSPTQQAARNFFVAFPKRNFLCYFPLFWLSLFPGQILYTSDINVMARERELIKK